MHWEKSSEQPNSRPYQGVRVKEPVKELLKRKRGNVNTNLTTTKMMVPHTTLSTYSQIGHSGFMEVSSTTSNISPIDDGTICTGWIAQPSSTTLQPLTHWNPFSEYVTHDASAPSYTADMYMQPMCPSYTVVGPSVLTYTSTPLFTNLGTRNTAETVLPQVEFHEPQASVAYIPWTQPISALPSQALQCSTTATPFPGTQFLPLPITVPEPAPHELEEANRVIGSLPIEKLLQEDDDKDTILHIYTAKGMREYAIVTAEKMRELKCLDAKEHHGKTPLLVAVTANQPYIVHDLLMLGADINSVDDKGQTAIHLAATYGYLEVIQVLLSLATNINLEVLDFEGHTPLHCAVLTHNMMHHELNHDLTISPMKLKELERKIVEVMSCVKLLVHAGACVTSQDIKNNNSVLHLAVQKGNYSLLKFFLEAKGGNYHDFINMKGKREY
ncbi:POU domain class 2-associating factor 1 [Erpetoichthys calabaricus]|uniref:POU domain class 2-associating factor 1 n=1 Tax=Erpetoichthys calabaricus TaxID=27687 RepID=UPI0022341BCE|nr:POU domain class 2-associating factor 1 [Erpetoichthys calabaricus]